MTFFIYYKILIINFLISFILLFSICYSNAQSFDLDQNPTCIKWRQINTKNFRIIYSPAFETEAQRMANTLQKIIPEVAQSLSKNPRKISLILQNQGIISNGFVTLAPRHSEFLTTPSQGFDTQDWLNSLAVHELRHVVQFDKLGGLFVKVPVLESYAGFLLNLQVPNWFWEGDAVGIETALTTAGRGRQPSFELAFRTNTLSGRKYSYSKDYLGSMKDITPGYYPLGFFMTTKMRRDCGVSILDSITTDMKNGLFRLYGFSRSLKHYAHLNTRGFHDATVAELDGLWQQQSNQIHAIKYPSINRRKDSFPADYWWPVALSEDEILVLKESQKKTPLFIRIDSNGVEKKVLRIGNQVADNFNYRSGKIVWDEIRFDKRFQKRSYNVINSYDMNTKKYRQLTHRSRLFAPALSPDGKTIVAVSISYSNDIELVELDSEDGHEMKRYANPERWTVQTPQFNADGSKIVCVAISKDGASLVEFDRPSGIMRQLIPFQQQQLAHPTYAGQHIVFKANYNGLDNIYSLNPDSKHIIQLTSALYGAFNPSYDPVSQKILFNNYQVRGYDVASTTYDENSGVPTSQLENTFIDYAKPLAVQEGNKNVFGIIPTEKYASKSYRELNHLFYFYQISPILLRNDQTQDNTFGFQLLSRDQLNTLDFSVGYQYNQGLRSNEYFASAIYKGFYPIFNMTYKNRAQLGVLQTGTNTIIPLIWREHYTELGTIVPFFWNQRNQRHSLGFSLLTNYTKRYDFSATPSTDFSNLNFPMNYQLYFGRNTSQSNLDLAPRWGENVSFTYRNFPFRGGGDIWSLRSTFFVPGLMSNHSFSASFNYQKSSGAYQYTIDIPTVSGYASLMPNANLNNTLLLNYSFPLLYPDQQLGPLAYIRRFRGGFFCDFENVGWGSPLTPRTFGITAVGDINLLRYPPIFSVGGKFIFVNQDAGVGPIVQLLLNISY